MGNKCSTQIITINDLIGNILYFIKILDNIDSDEEESNIQGFNDSIIRQKLKSNQNTSVIMFEAKLYSSPIRGSQIDLSD